MIPWRFVEDLQQRPDAWLERQNGERIMVQGSCFIGRSTTSNVMLPSEKVSRRHAMIQTQGAEYWLVDLGSANGTYLNGRRVGQPCRLNDRDQIVIADFQFIFRSNSTVQRERRGETTTGGETFLVVRSGGCWLLVADIISSTQLAQRLSPEEAPRVTGRWLAECKQIIDDHSGAINKFLGDGFFAYWMDEDGAKADVVAKAMTALRNLQQKSEPPFRVVVHHGKVFMGGGGSMGEESFVGNEVNFIFRMEKVASTLGLPFLVSETASRFLKDVPLSDEGAHPVPSFTGEFRFYGFTATHA
ncbi:MAG: adenylate/guanylate cyclase [Verrucomicrobiales bacterium]|nr:adenylate/guanylate cyclase [Verrucomicrobiales bacterium]